MSAIRTSHRSVSALASLALAAGLVVATPVAAHAADGVTAPVVVYVKPTGVGESRIPQVAHSGSQNVVVGWRNETVPDPEPIGNELGDIMVARSTDGGATFGAAVALAEKDATYTYGNFTLFTDPGTQIIYAHIARFPADAVNAQTPLDFIGFSSADGGASWTPFPVTITYPGPVNTGGVIIRYGDDYLLPFFHGTSRVIGVLRSADLATWSLAGIVYDGVDGTNPYLSEPFITVSNTDPTQLLVVSRAQSGMAAYTSTSADGGTTWTAPVADPAIINRRSKGFFANDGNNQYLHLYNNATTRDYLLWQQKESSGGWANEFVFADGPGDDSYASFSEYAPGKFFATWDNDGDRIMFGRFEADDTVGGQNTDWHNTVGWTVEPNGGSVSTVGSELRLSQLGAPGARIYRAGASGASRFTVQFEARITDYAAGTPGSAVSLGTKVTTGTDRVMLAVQADGVYAITASSPDWVRVWAGSTDNSSHTWRVDVASTRVATVFRDGVALASWTLPASSEPRAVEHWTRGTSTDATEAYIAYTRVAGVS